jgi:hypothetical protein
MAFHFKTLRVFYYVTGVGALLVALATAAFTLISGGGWRYLGLSLLAVVLLPPGLATSIWKPTIGSCLTAMGAFSCAIALLLMIWDLALVIPFRRYPGQALMLAPPSLLFLLLVTHIILVVQQNRFLPLNEVTPWQP